MPGTKYGKVLGVKAAIDPLQSAQYLILLGHNVKLPPSLHVLNFISKSTELYVQKAKLNKLMAGKAYIKALTGNNTHHS